MTTSELTISRLIKAPRSAVWAAWSNPEHFAKWWIPEPIRCKVVQMDMRPGGGFETEMSESDGPFQPHVKGCFLEVVQAERIVFTTVLVEGWRPFEPWLAMTAIISMADEGSGTRYTARALHRNEKDSKKHDEMGFQDGWGTTIDQLGKCAMQLS
ncbi:MAG: SRPBCC family protein [Rhodocyclaceae bacterium]|nr:SRPBCC family protein [Rhodocyclaceae bacterium]